MSATSWLTVAGMLLVALVGGALVGLPVGVAWERRRRARQMRERARRAPRRLPPTMLLPVVCSAPPPSLEAMRDHLRWTIRATPTERSRR